MYSSYSSMAFCTSLYTGYTRQPLRGDCTFLNAPLPGLQQQRPCNIFVPALPRRRAHRGSVPLIQAATSLKNTSGYMVRDVILQRVLKIPSRLPGIKTRSVNVDIKAEDLGGRRRRISGGIDIETSLERVWNVLTSYSKIALYMPNITESRMFKRSDVVYLDQVGIISRKLSLKSKMLVQVAEDRSEPSITFTRVEGRDFSEFVGRYVLDECGSNHTRLNYELYAVPFPLFPVSLVEKKIVKEVPGMLASIREEALVGKFIPLDAN